MTEEPASIKEICDLAFAELAPEDFDGHSCFPGMNPEQRLTWLSEIAKFVYQVKTEMVCSQGSITGSTG